MPTPEVTLKEAALSPPYLPVTEAVLLLVGEVLFPGIATIIFGAIKGNKNYVIIGLLQFALILLFLLGFIWAVVWGVLGVVKALKAKSGDMADTQRDADLPAAKNATAADTLQLEQTAVPTVNAAAITNVERPAHGLVSAAQGSQPL